MITAIYSFVTFGEHGTITTGVTVGQQDVIGHRLASASIFPPT
jgi:hypothetical protein